ncbi:MAG: RNA pyrophosphohydrolase [Pseudomonadota bacterium]|nr:RNA pyrophosphohydrolase [Pseudomonadota bacterium]
MSSPAAPASLPYRPCVGILLFNKAGHVWIGRRVSKWDGDRSIHRWQMPQGGIDEGETPEQAAFRELHEETGTREASILRESADWLTYDLPPEAIGVALKGRYRGQRQKWFAMRYLGDESDFDIGPGESKTAEFDAWRWVPLSDTVDLVVPFKRPVYVRLAEEFSGLGI